MGPENLQYRKIAECLFILGRKMYLYKVVKHFMSH